MKIVAKLIPAWMRQMWGRWKLRKIMWECSYIIDGQVFGYRAGVEQGNFTVRAETNVEARSKAKKYIEETAMTNGDAEIRVHRAGMLYVIFGPG